MPDSSLTVTGQFVGSPAYAPPEALVKGITGAASDVYGLGATLYEAAAGRWPRLEAKGALLAPVPPLRTLAPHAARRTSARRSIAPSRSTTTERPTAAELAELLARADTHARPPSAHRRARGGLSVARAPPRLRWKPYAIGLAVLVALAVFLSTRHSSPPAAAADRARNHRRAGRRRTPSSSRSPIRRTAATSRAHASTSTSSSASIGREPDALRVHDLRKQLDDLRKGPGHKRHGKRDE